MMMNLFNIFDPNIHYLPFNFILPLIILTINFKLWKLNSILKFFIYIKNKSVNLIFNNLINFILLMNLMNLIPLYFSMTNNIMLTLNLTLIFWMIMINLSFINNYNILMLNFTPKMTIMKLTYIINLIEFNSLMFLILSLSLRLMINMMMGHIIIFMINNKFLIYMYMFMELFIIFIQTYVYFILNLINLNNMN